MTKKNEQLQLFEDDGITNLSDTEEALLHYMQKCMSLEEELKEVRQKIAELQGSDETFYVQPIASRTLRITGDCVEDWSDSYTDESIISRGLK